jgi:hypothetical protein
MSLPRSLLLNRRRAPASLRPVAVLGRLGLQGWQFQVASLASIVTCTGLWVTAKTRDQTLRGHDERRALYVGLWTPTLYLVGRSLDEHKGG